MMDRWIGYDDNTKRLPRSFKEILFQSPDTNDIYHDRHKFDKNLIKHPSSCMIHPML
jgi:hypothetical protein